MARSASSASTRSPIVRSPSAPSTTATTRVSSRVNGSGVTVQATIVPSVTPSTSGRATSMPATSSVTSVWTNVRSGGVVDQVPNPCFTSEPLTLEESPTAPGSARRRRTSSAIAPST